jgi:hypothetical protein
MSSSLRGNILEHSFDQLRHQTMSHVLHHPSTGTEGNWLAEIFIGEDFVSGCRRCRRRIQKWLISRVDFQPEFLRMSDPSSAPPDAQVLLLFDQRGEKTGRSVAILPRHMIARTKTPARSKRRAGRWYRQNHSSCHNYLISYSLIFRYKVFRPTPSFAETFRIFPL